MKNLLFYLKGKVITSGYTQSNDNLREVFFNKNLVTENDVIVMQFLNIFIQLLEY